MSDMYTKVFASISHTCHKGGAPLSKDQKTLIAGSLAVWIDQIAKEAIAAWNTRAEGDARDAARYRGIRHAMANNDPHFVDAAEQYLERLGLLGCKHIPEDVIDAAFDAALTIQGAGND